MRNCHESLIRFYRTHVSALGFARLDALRGESVQTGTQSLPPGVLAHDRRVCRLPRSPEWWPASPPLAGEESHVMIVGWLGSAFPLRIGLKSPLRNGDWLSASPLSYSNVVKIQH